VCPRNATAQVVYLPAVLLVPLLLWPADCPTHDSTQRIEPRLAAACHVATRNYNSALSVTVH